MEMGKEEPKTTEVIIALDALVEIAGQNLQDWLVSWIKEDSYLFREGLPDDIEKVSVHNSFADNAGNVKLEIDFSGRKWFRDLDEINRCG